MRAAVFNGNRDRKGKLNLKDVEIPEIGVDEALLKVAYTGLCHTDVKKIWHDLFGIESGDPRVFGHEIVGKIAEIGDTVTSASVGDRVALFHHVPCEECEPCNEGNYAQCATYKSVDTTAGYGKPSGGGFAEYVRIPKIVLQKGVVPIPDHISFEEAVFIEPLNCTLKAMQKLQDAAPIENHEPVLVVGQGHQGLMFDQLITLNGGIPFATDKRRRRVKNARTYSESYTPRQMRKAAQKLGGFNKAIISAANPKAVEYALSLMNEGGTAIYFGDLMPKQGNVDWSNISRYERTTVIDGKTVIPSYSSSFALHEAAADLIFSKRIDVKSLVSQKIGLSDLEAAVEGAVKGFLNKGFSREEVMKVLVDPSNKNHIGYAVNSWKTYTASAGAVASLLLILGVGIHMGMKFSDCESVNNLDGTYSYICPTERDCGSLRPWEGELSRTTSNGSYECRFGSGAISMKDSNSPIVLAQANTVSRKEANHLKSLPPVPGFSPTIEYDKSLCVDLDGQVVCKNIVN